jgi:predicted nucleic acid-binding protein
LLIQLSEQGEEFATTRFNLAELYVGIERSTDPERESRSIDQVLRALTILDFDDRSARMFGALTAYLQKRGRPAGDMDVLTAAVAMTHGHDLVTRNAGHFAAIPGLTVFEY